MTNFLNTFLYFRGFQKKWIICGGYEDFWGCFWGSPLNWTILGTTLCRFKVTVQNDSIYTWYIGMLNSKIFYLGVCLMFFCCCFFFSFLWGWGEWAAVDGRWYAQTYIARKQFEYSTSQLPNTPGMDGTKLEILLMIRIICISLLWTLFIQVDFPIHIDTRWMACPFRVLMDHRSTSRYFYILLCLKIVFIQANSATSNKMPPYVALHLGL